MNQRSLLIVIICVMSQFVQAEHHEVIIIGSGPAGLEAAIYLGRFMRTPIVFEGENPGGYLADVPLVENFPGQASIAGFDLMEGIRHHAQAAGAILVPETVAHVCFTEKPFTIITSRQKVYTADAVIVATGQRPIALKCPSAKNFYLPVCPFCDGPLYKNKKIVIVGSGFMALKNAMFMKTYTKEITIIAEGDRLNAPAFLLNQVVNDPDLNILYNSEVQEIIGDIAQRPASVNVINTKTGSCQIVPAEGIFVSLGFECKTDMFREQLDLELDGHIKTTGFGHTNIPGVFAAGSVAAFPTPQDQAIACMATGYLAAIEAEKYISSLKQIRRSSTCPIPSSYSHESFHDEL